MSSQLTELKKRFERATQLDKEIKDLEKFPMNPLHVDAYATTQTKPYLDEDLLREVIRVGVKTVLSYKQHEFNTILRENVRVESEVPSSNT